MEVREWQNDREAALGKEFVILLSSSELNSQQWNRISSCRTKAN